MCPCGYNGRDQIRPSRGNALIRTGVILEAEASLELIC